MKDVRERAKKISGERTFQAEETTKAKALKQDDA